MIIVAGSINLDLIARVERLPSPGETVTGNDYTTAPGGKGANQALAARRAGADVTMIGAVGDDPNAQLATHLMQQAGIDLDKVKAATGSTATGVALILVDANSGENQIAVVPGANGTLEPDDIAGAAMAVGDFIVLQMEVPSHFNEAILGAARGAGAITILNIAPYGSHALELAKLADYTIANETEFDALAGAMKLAGEARIEKASEFARKTGKVIVITLGADGALAAGRDEIIEVASPKIKPIDTVGAGDTFCGAFAVALSEGRPVGDAMRFGCAAGALACLNHGAQPAIPLRSAIDALLKE